MTEDGYKWLRQVLSIAGILLLFASLWLTVWVFVTSRCVPDTDAAMQAKMIDVAGNLPHDPEAGYARLNSGLTLSGDLPVLDGAAALYPLYASFADAYYPVGSVEWDAEAQDFTPGSAVQYRNTVRGFKALLSGDADIFFSAKPSKAQLAEAEAAGVEIELIPIGREAFVFLVNTKNPVDNLTQDELRGLFTGRIRNWSEVGGADRMVYPLHRIEGSGSQSTLEAFLGGEKEYTNPLGFLGASIGFSFRWYVTDVVADGGVKMLSVDGVYPDIASVRDGSYPLTTDFYAMVRKDEDNPNVRLLIDLILSPEGQELIEANGYGGIGMKNEE